VLVHQRGGEARVGLAPFQRHPVVAVVGEQIEPFLEAVLVDQPRLVEDEADEILVGRHAHRRVRHIDNIMNLDQARNWLRICHSEVPLISAVSWSASAGSQRRWMLTHGLASTWRPSWARSYISRSSWPTIEVGALIS